MVGVPMAAIFDYAMGTPSGHAAFLDPDVNRMLKKILNEWGKYLKVNFHSFAEASLSECVFLTFS